MITSVSAEALAQHPVTEMSDGTYRCRCGWSSARQSAPRNPAWPLRHQALQDAAISAGRVRRDAEERAAGAHPGGGAACGCSTCQTILGGVR